MSTTYARWYTTGTIAVTNASATVTGTSTAWTGKVFAGDTLYVGGALYEIGADASINTELTLAAAFGGTTASGLSYAIIPTSVKRGLASDVHARLSELSGQIMETYSGDDNPPSNALGADGSRYYRTDVNGFYTKANGTWSALISEVGPGVPSGGTAGQIIVKSSGTDYDAEWTDDGPLVVVATGQSNFALRVPRSTYSIAETAYPSNVRLWNNTIPSGVSTDPIPVGTAFTAIDAATASLPFSIAEVFAQRYPRRTVYLIVVAQGSQFIDRWLSDDATPRLWTGLTANVSAALAAIGATQVDLFLWGQAESDESGSTDPKTSLPYWQGYRDKFEQLHGQLRSQTWFNWATPVLMWVPNFDNAVPRFFRMAQNILQLAAADQTRAAIIPPLESDGYAWIDSSAHLSPTLYVAGAKKFANALYFSGHSRPIDVVAEAVALDTATLTTAILRGIPDGVVFSAPKTGDDNRRILYISLGAGTVAKIGEADRPGQKFFIDPRFNGDLPLAPGTEFSTQMDPGSYVVSSSAAAPVSDRPAEIGETSTMFLTVYGDTRFTLRQQRVDWVGQNRSFTRQTIDGSAWTSWEEIPSIPNANKPAIALPSAATGGATVDAEARAALSNLLTEFGKVRTLLANMNVATTS